MAGYRDKVIYFINRGVNFIPPHFLQKLSGQKLILPVYHAVSDSHMPHISNLYPVKGVKAFTDDLDFLLNYFTPIDYQAFQELAKNNRQPTKPSFLLSFDDGLREFYDVIAPILIKKGIPAICFLNSGFIDNRDLFYRYKASLLIEAVKKHPYLEYAINDLLDRPQDVVQKLLSINYKEKELLDLIARRIDYSFENFLSAKSPYLTTTQINSLLKQGFHFGAHSVDHPEYQYIDFDEQVKQTKESMQYVCDKFSLDYKLFAFPFTDYNVSGKFFHHLNKEKIADFTFGCAGQKKDVIPTNYQRIPLEMANLSGRKIINAELLYYLIKIPFGKNVIKRT